MMKNELRVVVSLGGYFYWRLTMVNWRRRVLHAETSTTDTANQSSNV
jgi:hypothetical protein